MERQAELVVLDDLVTVEPGQIAQTSIRLRNTSDRVVHYALRPAPSGQAASWLRIVPDSLQLLEGDDGQAEVFVQPPPGAQSAAGRLPFAVIADPGPDSGLLPTVAEADVAVGAVHALDGRLIPPRVRGRFQGKIRADFNNLGNEVVRISVTGSDDADNEVLHFATADGRVAVPAGGSSGAFMKVRPDKPIVIGKLVDHPFVVTYARRSARSAQLENQESAEVTASLNGVFTQKPIISKWMMVVALLVVALAAVVFLVRRATAAEPVPPAPVVPVLTAKSADAGVLNLVFNVSDNPERVEVELIEPPADGNFDLATAIAGTQSQSEDSGSSRPVQVPLPESAEEADVFFRYRSVDVEERPSIWSGESVFRSSSIEFETPVIQNVAWIDAGQVSVVWSTPPNPDEVTLAYRLRNADTSVPIENAQIVSGNTNNAIVPVEGAPFAIEVQVFDSDDESQQSNWSEPMAPTGERPAVSTLPAPTIVRAAWFDHESVLVEWTSIGTGSTLTFELTDENGNRVNNAEELTPVSVRIPMPAPTLFGVRVRALDDATGERSPLSDAFVPDANARPAPPTIPTTAPPTTVPPATVPTTTVPALPKPQGFWILPQGANEPTNSTRVVWELALGKRLKQFEVAGSDLSDLTQNLEAPLSPASSVWVSDGYSTQADAVAECQRFVQQLVEDLSGLIVGVSDCWVVGPETTDFVQVPPPPPGDASATT